MVLMIQVPVHTLSMVKKRINQSSKSSDYLTVLNGAVLGRGVIDMQITAPAVDPPIATLKYNPVYLDENVREMLKQYV